MKVLYKERGVASVVGTLFALLLAVTLLSLFMTQYVPTYMHSSEAQRDMNLLSQYSQIKANIDLLISTGQLNYTIYSVLTLGASGIPFFGPSSPSSLRIISVSSGSPLLYINFTSQGIPVSILSGGMIDSYAYNAYYVQERIAYFDGFVIRENVNQNSSSIYVGTEFTIANVNGNYYITLTVYNIIGSNYYYVGTDSKNVGVSVLAVVKNTYLTSKNVYFNATGEFGNVILNWYYNQAYSFFNDPNVSLINNSLMFSNVAQITLTDAYVYAQVST